MFKDTAAFFSFSVDDLDKASKFYGETLGLRVSEMPEGLSLELAGGGAGFIYSKPNHSPASFTILNFRVPDIDEAVGKLKQLGVLFETYQGEIKTDEKDIFRGAAGAKGPNIAWFKDPAGNILSVVEQ